MSFLSLRNAAMHLLVVGIVASSGGCEDRTISTKPLVLKPVPFMTLRLEEGRRWRHYGPAHYVIRDEGYWRRLWRATNLELSSPESSPSPPPPPVDLAKQMIIIVLQGHCSSSGYGITISEIGETDTQLTVVVKYREPGPDEETATVETDPFYMISVPQSDKRVAFRIVEVGGSQ